MKPSNQSFNQPSGNTPDKRSRRITWLLGGLTIAISVAFFLMRNDNNPEKAKQVGQSSATSLETVPDPSAPASAASTASTTPQSASAPASTTSKPGASDHEAATTTGPEKTRASQRDSVVSSSGKRKSLIDPIASWSDTPPWPEGPRLFAEVETSARKYINLRPDDYGVMPRVLADAEERIELTINFPEGEPGEKIHVELPNGGAFTDTEARGRIYVLPENRTLTFPYITDEARGHCNVKFHHRGHSRSLPVWIGELPETASADSEP